MNPERLEVVRTLALDVATPGPWSHYRTSDGALILEDPDGEPVALVYAGLPLALYLEAVAPRTLLGGLV